MAHYARTTPPVRPPERPSLPDQYWTAWWQGPSGETPAGKLALDAGGPEHQSHDRQHASDASEVAERGGLRRVGVTPTGAPVARSADSGTGESRGLSQWGVLETAATAATPTLRTIIGGAFTLEGVAQRSGDLVFAGVTFSEPVDPAPSPDQIRLTFSDKANVVPDGVRVADLDGFAPSHLGFTLIATSLNPGALWVDGHYDVER
jgi:hypothetical protein